MQAGKAQFRQAAGNVLLPLERTAGAQGFRTTESNWKMVRYLIASVES
jgi:hypothetical protein